MLIQVTGDTFAQIRRMHDKCEKITSDRLELVEKGDCLCHESDWSGGDRTKWLSHWEGEVTPCLEQVDQALKTVAGNVERACRAIEQAGGGLGGGDNHFV